MKSYIATKRRKDGHMEARFHVEAESIVQAAILAHEAIDSLWEIIRVEVLR